MVTAVDHPGDVFVGLAEARETAVGSLGTQVPEGIVGLAALPMFASSASFSQFASTLSMYAASRHGKAISSGATRPISPPSGHTETLDSADGASSPCSIT